MIELKNLSKGFEDKMVLKGVTTKIASGSICGLIGSNGAGKSTLLRCISGVYKPVSGEMLVDGQEVYENPVVKQKMFFQADDSYFPSGADMEHMAWFYKSYYQAYDLDYFHFLCETFRLDPKKKLQSLSKGMRRQAAMVMALASRPEVLLLDESFDGLDPVVKDAMRKLLCCEVADRAMTVLVSSHSLRELQDLCDQLLFLHDGKILLDQGMDSIGKEMLKLQVAFQKEYDRGIFEGLDIVKYEKNGTVANLIVRGSEEEIRGFLEDKHPILMEILPLALEEMFLCEVQALGYSFDIVEKGDGRDE
ncbi:MAG: ABC transporter ATP-binding protein [Lachnospiraceae bacterium]|nr:ABC transporter ATP-binding protein [Lachnospiraceae bacterium]